MKLSLVVLNAGKASGQAIPVTLPQFVIGRDPQCNLRPASVLVSKRHCAVITEADKTLVRDFGSTNGTFVNDKPVKGDADLADGDILKVGPLTFRVSLEVKAPTPTPAPAIVPGPALATVPVRPATTPTVKKMPTGPAAARGGQQDEEAAALLLALEDSPTADAGAADSVPDGSTIMDLPTKLPTPVPPTRESETAPVGAPAAEKKDEKKAPAAPKSPSGAAQQAAKAILEKYSKRSR
jgi:pSer/pThr/pTyr-binding forkhead associated (FHA) protein